MGISIIFVDIVIAHWATRLMVMFPTFLTHVLLFSRENSASREIAIPIHTPIAEPLTLLFGLLILGYVPVIWGVIEYHDSIPLLPEEEAQIPEGTAPALGGGHNEETRLYQDDPSSENDSHWHDNLVVPTEEDDSWLEDAPLIQSTNTSPYQDTIESTQDGRKLRNIFARYKGRIQSVSFIRNPGRPVSRYYLLLYTSVFALDSLCLCFWILGVVSFPWARNWWLSRLAATRFVMPDGMKFPGPNGPVELIPINGTMRNSTQWSSSQIQSWSAWWWPNVIVEVVNVMLFTVIYIEDLILIIWPLTIWWRGSRSNAISQRPKGRRVILASQGEIAHLYQDEEPALIESSLVEYADGIELADLQEGLPETQA